MRRNNEMSRIMEGSLMHPKQQAILKAIKTNPEITVRELQAICEISSPSVVQHHLLVLQAEGVIKKINRWEIKKKHSNGK